MELAISELNEKEGQKSRACFLTAFYCGLLGTNGNLANIIFNSFTFSKNENNKSNFLKVTLLTEKMTKAISSESIKLPMLLTTDGTLVTSPIEIIKKLAALSSANSVLVNLQEKKEKEELERWMNFVSKNDFAISSLEALKELDTYLERRTFLVPTSHITVADLAVYSSVYDAIELRMKSIQLKRSEETTECKEMVNLLRWFDHIQNLPGIKSFAENFMSLIDVTKMDSWKNTEAFFEKTKNKQEEIAINEITGKKERKPKEDKKNKEEKKKEVKKEERAVDDVTRLDVRIGIIRKVWRHPDAEKLYCEEIDIGEKEVRKIASGLVNFIKEEDLVNQKVLVIANMKPKALRGFTSHGMVLCATSSDKSKVELMKPPADTPIGERVIWEGLEGEPDTTMNTKTGKDPFVAVQSSFKTGEDKIGYYKERKFVTSCGYCYCDSLVGATIS